MALVRYTKRQGPFKADVNRDRAFGQGPGQGRIRTLPILPSGPSITRLDEGIFGDSRHTFSGGNAALPPNPPPFVIDATPPPEPATPVNVNVVSTQRRVVHTMMVNIVLLANIPQILVAGNTNRIGVQIQNSDTANSFFYAIGSQASATFGFLLPANATVLYDFITPNDIIWGLTTAASLVVTIADFSATYL